MNRLNLERMAASFLSQLTGLRLLLVVAGVTAIFAIARFVSPDAELQIGAVDELTAGEMATVELRGEANEKLELSLRQKDGLDIRFIAQLDESGSLFFEIPGSDLEQAGLYSLAAGYKAKRSNFSAETQFEVLAASPDLETSRITFSSLVLEPDQTSIMSVVLNDAYGNPVSGHSLNVVPSSSAVSVLSSDFVTNEKGQMNFSILGNGDGAVSLSLFDLTLGETILAPTQIVLRGGEPITDSSVVLASGAVDSFVIEGLETESEVGVEDTITVKAVDEEGFTVTDYTGTIRFSSTDDQASLPTDYTFLAEDLGEHSFSLGVKFVTPGEQTVMVTDIENIRVNGDADTTVVTAENSGTDYGSDFETTDYTRDGDFDLISPASGFYSTDSVEIQGEAEYGYNAFVMLNDEEVGEAEISFDNSFSYTLQDLEDGSYDVFVEIRDDEGTVVESSTVETVTVDTVAPEVLSVSLAPTGALTPATEFTVTVLSEANLEEVSVLFEGEVYVMEETSTSGKYQVALTAPEAGGDYALGVLMADTLGNEAEYREQATVTVASDGVVPDANAGSLEGESSVGVINTITATGGPSLVALSWEAPASNLMIAYYRVYYGPSPSALFAVSETTDSSTNWTVPGLVPNELYYFAVVAVDVEGTEGEMGMAVLGVPQEGGAVASNPVPTYPVSNTLATDISKTPETGPASTALILLSTLGALAYVLLRRAARS